MSYTTRQVQSLLNQSELDLFLASRSTAIKEFTARQLVGKITRARALRDKYRDLYQRQTVRTATGPASARKVMGGENSRTDVKADVMQEVLSRFEAQFEKVQSKPGKAKKKTPSTASARAPVGGGRATGNADIAMRGVKGTTPRQLARSQRAAEAAATEAVKARGAKSTRAGTASTANKAPAKTAAKVGVKAPAKTAAKTAAKAPAKTPAKASAKTAAKAKAGAAAAKNVPVKTVSGLVKAVRKAVAKKASAAQADDQQVGRKRGGKTLVSGSPSDLAQGAVPMSMPAAAARKNPLKAEPVNLKIHASARSRTRAAEARRDSR